MKNVLTGCLLIAVLAVSSWHTANGKNQDISTVVRANAIELVDTQGRVRAQFSVDGEEVVLRLRDSEGQIRVKLGASSEGSGLLLLDESTEPGIHMLARSESTLAMGLEGEVQQILPAQE